MMNVCIVVSALVLLGLSSRAQGQYGNIIGGFIAQREILDPNKNFFRLFTQEFVATNVLLALWRKI